MQSHRSKTGSGIFPDSFLSFLDHQSGGDIPFHSGIYFGDLFYLQNGKQY
jgi:hypothetical protein